jgi:hypothetical protein
LNPSSDLPNAALYRSYSDDQRFTFFLAGFRVNSLRVIQAGRNSYLIEETAGLDADRKHIILGSALRSGWRFSNFNERLAREFTGRILLTITLFFNILFLSSANPVFNRTCAKDLDIKGR